MTARFAAHALGSAEWEFAAREVGTPLVYAGTSVADSLSAFAFTGSNSFGFSLPVGLKRPNALGLHDMTGNVSKSGGAYNERYPELFDPSSRSMAAVDRHFRARTTPKKTSRCYERLN